MKRFLTLTIPIALAACTTLGDVEKQAIHDRAIADIRNQSKEIHLAYLQCYALRNYEKDQCKRQLKWEIDNRKDASTWEYILPFDHEAERLGFKAFLQDNGKKCDGVDEWPKFNEETNSYNVICTDKNQYSMHFNYETSTWHLTE